MTEKKTMAEKKGVSRYSRFWSAFGKLTLGGNDASGVKDVLVLQYTNGRTSHLHEMAGWEYVRLCEALERDLRKVPARNRPVNGPAVTVPARNRSVSGMSLAGLKALRSRVLVEMRHWGVAGLHHNSVNWSEVDRFCLDKRISGKRFCLLNEEELESLLKKLIAMNVRRMERGE